MACAPTPQASAQETTSNAHTSYDALIAEGATEFELGNFQEAYAVFKAAHDLRPSARTLRGLGMCAFNLRRYVRAVAFLDGALASDVQPLDERQRADAAELRSRARRFLSTLVVRVEPADAEVVIGGQSRGPGKHMLPVGKVEVRVHHSGYQSAERHVLLEASEVHELNVALEPVTGTALAPAAAAAPPPEPATPVPDAALEANDDGSVMSSPWLWVGVGTVALAGVVLALVAGGGGDGGDSEIPEGNVGGRLVTLGGAQP